MCVINFHQTLNNGDMIYSQDILPYPKIIVALWETDRIMKKIDNIEIE
jgi:hypothetical protein